MADYTRFDTDAFENVLPPPDGWPEHTPPRNINDTGREMQAAVAGHVARVGTYPLSTGGEDGVYRIAIPLNLTDIPAGFRVGFTAHQTNATGNATFQINDFAAQDLVGSPEFSLTVGDIVAGRQYDLSYTGDAWGILFTRPIDTEGDIGLDFIPQHLAGVDVGEVNELNLSTGSGTDANTVYFRTSNGGEIYHGDTRVEDLQLGGTEITTVQHGSDYVYAIPRAVASLTLTSLNDTDVRITWTAPTVASLPITYRLERADDSEFTTGLATLLEDSTALTYDNTGLAAPATFYFRVRAENYIGDGAYAVAAITTAGVAPSLPRNFSASASSSSAISLGWSAPSTGTPASFTYTLQRATSSSFLTGLTTLLSRSSSSSYSNTGLSSSTTYYYRVRAHNLSGSSSYTSTSATTPAPVVAPGSVSTFTATAVSSSRINLSWSAPSTGTTPFTYTLRRGSTVLLSGSSSTSYANTGLTASTAYSYTVRAQNSAGNGSYTSASTTTFAASAAPTVPSGVTATALDDDRIRVSWTASTGTGTITYQVRRGSTSVATGLSGLTYTNSGLTANTAYSYSVRATNNVGSSAYSSSATATTHSPPAAVSVSISASTPIVNINHGSPAIPNVSPGSSASYAWRATFTASPSGGTTPYTYDWSGTTGETNIVSSTSKSTVISVLVTTPFAAFPPSNQSLTARVTVTDNVSTTGSATYSQTVAFV